MKIDWFAAICMSMMLISICAVFVLCKETDKKGKRIRHLAILVAAIFAFAFVGIAAAGAETAEIEYFVVEEIVGVTAENFDGEVIYRIDFVFHDNILSWYEDEPVHSGRTYILKIWRGMEVVNSAWI